MIRQFDIFSNLTQLEVDIIERSVYRRTYKRGGYIVRESDAGVGMYLIESGEVKVYKSIKNSRVELSTISAGSFFGELTLLREGPRIASVAATEKTTVLCLFRPEFLSILDHYPAIGAKFLPAFAAVLACRVNSMYRELEKYRDIDLEQTTHDQPQQAR